mgnify:CR=1 FL=1
MIVVYILLSLPVVWFVVAASRCYTRQEFWVDVREVWDEFWK